MGYKNVGLIIMHAYKWRQKSIDARVCILKNYSIYKLTFSWSFQYRIYPQGSTLRVTGVPTEESCKKKNSPWYRHSHLPTQGSLFRGRRPRPCWISVKTIYWSGDFQERFFLFDPSVTSGMSAALMQGHCIRRRPCIKQHMSGGPEFHRKYHRQLPPHFTRHETLHAAGLD